MIATPSFWYQQKTISEVLLKVALMPLGWAYGWLVRKKFDLYFPVPMSKPVICVGNLVAGGAGKTPVVLSLAELLLEKGYNPHLLTRGYGGKESGPLQVSPGRDTTYDVGDEALLLVDKAPTWVSANRPLGAQEAMDSGANIIIMDDGFQNSVIYKDFSFLVIDGIVGLGNKQVMPAGPLREGLKFGLSRADAVVVIGEDKTGAADYIRRLMTVPILHAALVADGNNPDVEGKKVFAFAGIGRPQKFRETLEAAGAVVEGWKEFPDHFPYDDEDLKEFMAAADAAGDVLLTTAKDYVRIPDGVRQKIQKFSVHLVWQNPSEIVPLIEQALQKRMT
ncbi:MAG: tetraacyldisaccharide 4'-kinase [Proteobacteria bacterium]|nr:tetraacyldisaccharide 4'-kinase [Pseudomonadota bacterium]